MDLVDCIRTVLEAQDEELDSHLVLIDSLFQRLLRRPRTQESSAQASRCIQKTKSDSSAIHKRRRIRNRDTVRPASVLASTGSPSCSIQDQTQALPASQGFLSPATETATRTDAYPVSINHPSLPTNVQK